MSETLAVMASKCQRITKMYQAEFGIEPERGWHLLKLTEELGELTAAHLELSGQGRPKGKTSEALKQNLAEEAADILGFLLAYCAEQGIDPEQALTDKWFKYLQDID